jgi:hypothetical protein
MKIEEKFNQKLLVEGNDDQHVIWAVCQKFDLPHNFDVIDTKGVDQLITQIPVRLKTPELQTLGIVLDADTDLNSRWESLKAKLIASNYELPEEFPQEGLILEAECTVKVGIWLMPNNAQHGMLEDFIQFLVPKGDALLEEAKAVLAKIEGDHIQKYKEVHHSKALIHTWLAWQEDPGTPMGLAITKKYLVTEGDEVSRFVDWLRRLFS